MRILELTNYSAGICGVFTRVKHESELLTGLGHKVMIFSSNLEKGTGKKVSQTDKIGMVQVQRFNAKKLGGESFMQWDFEEAAIKFKPDIVIAHSYRHTHTMKALKLKKKLNCKVFLVTHAPFIQANKTRTLLQKLIVTLYDTLIGPWQLKKFDKIIVITKWEIKHLVKLGVWPEKIIYIPNGIPKEFFSSRSYSHETQRILFLGRVSKIKNLEILIDALGKLKNNKITVEIVGPTEKGYFNELTNLVTRKKLQKRIIFSQPIFNIKDKIKKLDSASIFVLPSKSEAMPQSLIEAMARERIVVASDTPGTQELILNKKNGFIFENNNANALAETLTHVLESSSINVKKNARKSVEKFSWDKVLIKLNELIKN